MSLLLSEEGLIPELTARLRVDSKKSFALAFKKKSLRIATGMSSWLSLKKGARSKYSVATIE
jgi:hypothetical protein